MINLKFKGHDSGNCRVYFTNNRKLYCLMQSYRENNQLALYICTSDGEPDCITDIDYKIDNHSKADIEAIRPDSDDRWLDNKLMDFLGIERRTWYI